MTSALIRAWDAAQNLVAHAVALSRPNRGGGVLFPNASDDHRWGFLTQVPRGELDRSVPVEDMTHEPLGFLDKVLANRGKQREAASRCNLPNFVIGEYILVARMRRSGSMLKLLMTWTGPRRVVVTQRAECRIRRGSRRPCCSDSFLRGCRSRDHYRAEGSFLALVHARRV